MMTAFQFNGYTLNGKGDSMIEAIKKQMMQKLKASSGPTVEEQQVERYIRIQMQKSVFDKYPQKDRQ